ncbi:MAG: hypothetical protein M3P48_08480, partial [Actinomycetota bacterium]|nr:hypothetical protein [Actinomycetota bacterium]
LPVLAPTPAGAGTAQRLDMRVLLIAGPAGDATTEAWRTELERHGVAYTAVVQPGSSNPVTRDQLVDAADPDHGYFNAVVLGTESSLFWGGLDEVYRYEREFGVRQLDGFEYPRESVGLVGLEPGTYDHAIRGQLLLTSAGMSAFPYLKGPVPFDDGSYGYLAQPKDANFTPYLRRQTVDQELVLGVYRHPDVSGDPKAGVEEMVMTVNYNDQSLQWRLLSRGMIDWVTRGAHFGYARAYLANQVDDVFLPNDVWSVTHNCTPGDDDPGCTAPPQTVRMTAKDVQAVASWQKSRGFVLDMTFNGAGYAQRDGLSSELVKNKAAFRWTNHTWSHSYLSRPCLSYDTTVSPATCTQYGEWPTTDFITDQIKRNQDFAARVGLPINRTELVTGEHSGLDNPNMPEALRLSGITTIAADNSRDPAPRPLGAALTSPRHPSNVYYNVSTWEQQLDEYNWLYLDRNVDPRNGNCVNTSTTTCRTTPATQADFLNSESRIMLGKVLSNDPRVGYSHQSNLTGDRILLAFLDRVLNDYRSWTASNAPLVTQGVAGASAELQRKAAFDRALAAGQINGYVQGGTMTITASGSPVVVPVTAPAGTVVAGTTTAFGSAYAGTRSAWTRVEPAKPLVLTLP